MEMPGIDDAVYAGAHTDGESRHEMNRRTFLATAAASATLVVPMSSAFAGTDKFTPGRDCTVNGPGAFRDPGREAKAQQFAGEQPPTPLHRIWHGGGSG